MALVRGTGGQVKVYIAKTRAREWIRKLEELGFGEMLVRGEMPPKRLPWAFDNGAFRDWSAGKTFDAKAFELDLETIWRFNGRPDFIVVPDIVAGGKASLEFSRVWAEHKMLKIQGCPLYLAVQDGMGLEDVEPVVGLFDGIFVGGTMEWKVKTAASWVRFAHAGGRPCHIGRAGTERHAAWARRIGADSIDSALPLWSEANLARFCEDCTSASESSTDSSVQSATAGAAEVQP